MRYLITFACYGQHLHGAASGSVDRLYINPPGSRLVAPNAQRFSAVSQRMVRCPYLLQEESRTVLLRAIIETCSNGSWGLLAAHVRMTHVHVIVEAEVRPEKVMNALKSYASRDLNRFEAWQPARRRWARHGSTRWLWRDQEVRAAIQYVIEEQGEPMAVFAADTL